MTYSPHPPRPEINIRILGTSDLHMNLCGFDYYTDTPDPSFGFARTANLIRTARDEAEASGAHVVLLDNGDSLQGAPIGEWSADPENGPHIFMQALNLLGFDAIGLGNHDFGFGLEVLDRILTDAPCPVLCSNAHRLGAPQTWQSHAILTRKTEIDGQQSEIKIGLFSVLPPQTAKWEAHKLQGRVALDDILTCARNKVAELRADGCDLVIALAHTGLGPSDPEPDLENAVIPLAAIDGIDAIIAGHAHLTLPGPSYEGWQHVDAVRGCVHGKPVVMPGSAGSYLGVIDLTVQQTADGRWVVASHRSELRSVCPLSPSTDDPATEDPDLIYLFEQAHTETRRKAAQAVGHTEQHLHSYFSFCSEDRGLALAAAAQAAGLRPYLQGTAYAQLPLISAIAPSKFGGRAGPRFFTDVPAGEICLRHVKDLYVFPNELQALILDGAQLGDWLEMSASVFNQIIPGQETNLVDPGRVGHNFDILHGLSCQIDLTQPARFDPSGQTIHPQASRVRNILFQGNPLRPDQRFVVALNNYRANGGGHFPHLERAERIPLPILSVQEVLQAYIAGNLPQDPLHHVSRPFRFAPIPGGATALIRTGSKATQHISELDAYRPQVLGEDAEGFLQIRLAL